MTHCPHRHRLQDFLDGELPADDARAFVAHLEGCAGCAADLELFARVDEALRSAPAWDPGLDFTERVLDRVVPSRLRRRFVTVVGWTYGTATAVSTFALASWLSRPGTPAWIASALSELYLASLRTGVFAFQTVVAACFRLGNGAGLLGAFSQHLSPLVHAGVLALSHPVLGATLVSAALGSIGVLWWMRPSAALVRWGRRGRGADHVGLLGL